MEHEEIFIHSLDELHQWLQEHHGEQQSYWLCRYKKDKGPSYISYSELVDELLCWGWIDSLPGKKDEATTLVRISPRNPKSYWSAVNKKKVTHLLSTGRMQAAGLEAIEKAKANGAWTFLDDVEALVIPDDLEAALTASPPALQRFHDASRSFKRNALEKIKSAKRPETRLKRIEDVVKGFVG